MTQRQRLGSRMGGATRAAAHGVHVPNDFLHSNARTSFVSLFHLRVIFYRSQSGTRRRRGRVIPIRHDSMLTELRLSPARQRRD